MSYSFGTPYFITISRGFLGGFNQYRFSFNGKEKINEISGAGNNLDFGARIYDDRLGRWLSLDPLMIKYPYLSPFNFVANSPLMFIDPNGKEIKISGSQEFVTKAFSQLQSLTSNQLVLLSTGVVMEANKLNEWQAHMVVQTGAIVKPRNFVAAIEKPFGTLLISKSIDAQKVISIVSTDNYYHDENETKYEDPQNSIVPGVGSNSIIYHDPNDNGTKSKPHIKNQDGTVGRDSKIGLAHELIHALKGALGKRLKGQSSFGDPDNLKKNGKTYQLSNEEVDTRNQERTISEEQGEPIRAKPLAGKVN